MRDKRSFIRLKSTDKAFWTKRVISKVLLLVLGVNLCWNILTIWERAWHKIWFDFRLVVLACLTLLYAVGRRWGWHGCILFYWFIHNGLLKQNMPFCGCFFRNIVEGDPYVGETSRMLKESFSEHQTSVKNQTQCVLYFFLRIIEFLKNSLPISFKMHKSTSCLLCVMWVCLNIYMSQYANDADQNKNKCNSFVFKFNIQFIHNEILKKKFTNFSLSQSCHSSDLLCQKNKTWD